MIGFLNSEYLPKDQIKIPVDNLAVNRGYGAFDFFGIKNNKPFYGDRHIRRFLHSLHLMKLFIEYSENELIYIIQNLIQKNTISDFYLKLFALPTHPNQNAETPSSLIIIPVDAPEYDAKLYSHGAKLISKEYTRFLPEAKSTNYLPMVYWYNEMLQYDAVDVLYKTHDIIKETSRGNIFCIKNDEFRTPSTGMLAGVTRSIVLDILHKQQSKFTETEISYNELLASDEVFLSSTTKKIMPVVSIDNKSIGNGKPGSLTLELMRTFGSLQTNW